MLINRSFRVNQHQPQHQHKNNPTIKYIDIDPLNNKYQTNELSNIAKDVCDNFVNGKNILNFIRLKSYILRTTQTFLNA